MNRGTAGGAGEGVAPWLAALLALAATGLAIRWGAFVAGGSDSHCYVAQARMWLDGTILRPFEPGLAAAWPNARESLAPIGFVPSQVVPGGLAPIDLVFELWEVPVFRERFGGASDAGKLDWPPRAQIGRDVTVYDPAARARYLRGESVPSERVWTASERRRFR